MADFKKLHEKWKDAKKTAKSFHDVVARWHLDVTEAHKDVKIGLGPFPKFNLDLGPSLDDIAKNKNVAKAKKQAEKALKQYEKDIQDVDEVVKKLKDQTDAERKKIQDGYKGHLKDFAAIRDEIEKEVAKLNV